MPGANYLYTRAEASGLIDTPKNPVEAFDRAALKETIMDSDSAMAKRNYKRLTELRA